MIINNNIVKDYSKYILWEVKNYPKNMREDLIQEGYLGLILAMKKFNPDKNVKVITYALYYIRHYIRAYYRKNKRMFEEYIDDFSYGPQDFITPIFDEQVKKKLPAAMRKLDIRQQDIIENRYMTDDPVPLHIIGKSYNISEERTRQIEVQSLLKLRKKIDE